MTFQRMPVTGPWKGIISDVPPPGDPTMFDDALNFLMTKGRLATRPKLTNFLYTDGPLLGAASFQDAVNNFHTLFLTINKAEFLTTGPLTLNPLINTGTFPGVSGYQTGRPYGMAELINQVYFCNGSSLVTYVDGSNSTYDAGDVPGSCLFLEVDGTGSHLIGANWFEPQPGVSGATSFPRRVRWTDSGNPLEWIAAPSNSAGLNDLEECPDSITGMATLGRNTYIYRTDGITVMYPTGVGNAPFAFEDLSKSNAGIGSVFPYALAKYDSNCIAISFNDVYLNSNGTQVPIAGGKVKKRIFADLAANSGGFVTGAILPSLGPAVDFLAYYLNIPGPNVTWVYSFDDENWTRINSSLGCFTQIASLLVA